MSHYHVDGVGVGLLYGFYFRRSLPSPCVDVSGVACFHVDAINA